MTMAFFLRLVLSAVLLCCSVNAFSAERPKSGKNDNASKVSLKTEPPVTVLSIIPAQAEPGGKVLMSGTGFGESVIVYLGSVEIAATVIDGRQVEFNVPNDIEAGLYALYMKREDGAHSRAYNFTILPLRPVLMKLQPAAISSCSVGKEREVIAAGSNFSVSSLLFFDGASLVGTYLSSQAIAFVVPNVAGGLHQIQVKNSSDSSSVPLNLVIETKPEIDQISIGSEHVSSYELIITGKNFTRNSTIYVDGFQIGGRGGQDMAEREKLEYVDCTRMVYHRHPYSPVNKDIRLQVANPGGELSQTVTVTAP